MSGLWYTVQKGGGSSWNPSSEGDSNFDPEDITEGPGVDPSCQYGDLPPLSWNSVQIGIGEDRNPLNGFTVKVRYFVKTVIGGGLNEPDEPDTCIFNFPNTTIVSMTLTQNGYSLFDSKTNDELFGESNVVVNETSFATAGIRDGTAYSYPRVFDQAEVSWRPRLSPSNQSYMDVDAAIPGSPYEPSANPPKYPIDGLSAFVEDPRESVTVSYQLTTVYSVGGNQKTDTVTINHTVTQPLGNSYEKIIAMNKASYFGNGIVHMGLYPPDYEAIYDESGNLIGEINEPFDMIQLTRRSYPYDFDKQDYRQCPESPN